MNFNFFFFYFFFGTERSCFIRILSCCCCFFLLFSNREKKRHERFHSLCIIIIICARNYQLNESIIFISSLLLSSSLLHYYKHKMVSFSILYDLKLIRILFIHLREENTLNVQDEGRNTNFSIHFFLQFFFFYAISFLPIIIAIIEFYLFLKSKFCHL